ncbi:ribosomal protein S16 [Piedraia hortae CBS 480.64]|uniref:Ribosomal protein S16 n=1 Tax=Piedraia hortae CBS 480.64 TaxID=1314780 RepID=A0A6A7C3L4_9PEZI|nr:ribosomal protein S16 [Piedraia hortae CBS 480.64]
MVLRLRLARVSTPGGARRHKPVYNIVLAHARTARDSKPLEVLGTYNPIPSEKVYSAGVSPTVFADEEIGTVQKKVKDIKLDVTRTKYWLGVGAQPSERVWKLLSMIGLLPPKYRGEGDQVTK